jgi:hypothetical protein
MSLADQLLHLCNFKLPDNHQGPMSMAKDFSALKSAAPLDLIVPLQASLTVTLPERKTTTSYAGHRPFTAHLPTIRGKTFNLILSSFYLAPLQVLSKGLTL